MSYTHILFTVEYRKHQTVKMNILKKKWLFFLFDGSDISQKSWEGARLPLRRIPSSSKNNRLQTEETSCWTFRAGVLPRCLI